MDSLTQAVLGASVGYAIGGKTLGRKAALWGIALGTLPDLDVLIPIADPVESFTSHRGFSHSLFVLTLISPLIAEGIRKVHGLLRGNSIRLTFMVWLALITHPVLDSFTSYGTQLFWPISKYPVALSSVSIVDPIYTVPLLIATILALIMKYGKRPYRAVIAALVISSIYLGYGLVLQNNIEQRIATELEKQGISSQALLVTPTLFNSMLWYVVAVDDNTAWYGFTSIFDAPDYSPKFENLPRNSSLLGSLKDDPEIIRLMEFSHNFYAMKQENGLIIYSDLRMGIAPVFVFSFALAKLNGDLLKPTQRVTADIDTRVFNYLWQRIWNVDAERPVKDEKPRSQSHDITK